MNQYCITTILVEQNGRAFSSKRTHHINIQYFFIKDRIASGEVELDCCPTETMLDNVFTKQLSAFSQFRDGIMNVSRYKNYDIKTLCVLRIPDDKMRKPPKECTNTAEKSSLVEKIY